VDIYSRRKSHNSSLALLATLVLGVAIGLSVGYAVWGTRGEAPKEVTAPPTAAAPEPEGQKPAPIKTAEAVTPDAKVPAPPVTEPMPKPVPEPETPPATEPMPKPVPEPETPPATEPTTGPVPEPGASPDLQGRYQDGAETWPGLFLFVGIAGPTLDQDTKKLLAEIKPGGVVLLGTNLQDPATVLALTSEIKQAEGLGRGIDSLPFVAVEQEGGDLNSLGIAQAPSATVGTPAFADMVPVAARNWLIAQLGAGDDVEQAMRMR